MKYFMLFATTGLLAAGQVLFKLTSAHNPNEPWSFLLSPIFLASLVVYGVAVLFWVFVLREFPLSVAYPMQALAIVLVLAISFVFFGEHLRPAQWVGAIAILTGLVALALG
jgi:multidrug transporter EmrE-like cation transporter